MNSPITAILGTAGRVVRPLAVLLLFAALAAPSAHAGSYVVVGCADLAGALGPAHTVRPAEGWYLAAGVYPSRDDCAAGRAGRGLFATGERVPNLFRFDAPPATSIAGLVTTYRAHLSGAAAWAVPTLRRRGRPRRRLGVHPPGGAATSAPARWSWGRRAPTATPAAPRRCGSASAASSRPVRRRAASRGRASTPSR